MWLSVHYDGWDGGMVMVVAVAVLGVTVVPIIFVIGPDGVPRLYAGPALASCLYALHLYALHLHHFVCLSILPHQKKNDNRRRAQQERWAPDPKKMALRRRHHSRQRALAVSR